MDKNILIIIALVVSSIFLGIRIMYFKSLFKSLENKSSSILKNKFLYIGIVGIFFIMLILYSSFKIDINIMKLLDFVITMVIISLLDLKYKIVPNEVLVCLLVSQLIMSGLTLQFGDTIINVTIGLLLLGVISLISFILKGKIGMGDAKLLAVMVLVAGVQFVLKATFFGLFFAFFVSIILLLIKKVNVKTELPFVPFITIGVFIAIFI